MAVEAQHLNLFPPQLIQNREIMNAINTQMEFGLLPFHSSVMADSIQATTCNLSLSRKRSREFMNFTESQKNHRIGSFSFLGEDISLQIHEQQSEIDNYIVQHAETVRLELTEQRRRFTKRIVAAIDEVMVKKLEEKEEELEKMKKLNWVLEERVKNLCFENQIWRELAQTNEDTVNTLRLNLEQVLTEVNNVRHHGRTREDDSVASEAESCCDSNDFGEEEKKRRTLVENGRERKWVKDKGTFNSSNTNISLKWCRNCGEEESSVLLLPCRHLCLCTLCGSTLHVCPVCKSTKNASIHVNMSS